MRTRHVEILRIMLNIQVVDVSRLMRIYDISKRTLFYDLEEINHYISRLGKLRVEHESIILEGDLDKIDTYVSENVIDPFYVRQERQERILLSILEDENKSLDDFVEMFGVGKTTIFSDIELIRSELLHDGLSLEYNKRYYVEGSEYKVRDIYLRLLAHKPFDYRLIKEDVLEFNKKYNLYLSDYSMFYLSQLLNLIKRRGQASLSDTRWLEIKGRTDVEDVCFDVMELIENKDESQYLKSYILSISTSSHRDVSKIVSLYVNELLTEVKFKMALDVKWDSAFINSLQNHLIASYYRIKFGYPALNPSLNEIRVKYFYLYLNIKTIVRSIDHISIFHQMRDEEIGFVVAYIGGYLYEYSSDDFDHHRVILVCPHGRAVAHHLSSQIEKLFPNVEIIGAYSINQLGSIVENYDTILTTLDLPYYQNVIKVHPILSEGDKEKLQREFGNITKPKGKLEDKILEAVGKHATILNRDELVKDIHELLKFGMIKERYQPMLNELITKERIQVVDSIGDWKEAIALASVPLIKENVFGDDYVQAMINGVQEFGPYIVLADEFALPHASSQGDVKEIAISVLVTKEAVDMKGKPVKVFMVLATVDNESHLKALSALSDIIGNDDDLALIKEGDVDVIYNLLGKGGV